MKELGNLLKEARKERQLSLGEISEQTRIQVHYLEALENGDFSKFAGEVYVKGSLRSYAEVVGLDHEELFRLYHSLKGEPAPEEKVTQISAGKPKATRFNGRERGPSLIYGMILVILLLAAGGYWFTTRYIQRKPIEPHPPGNEAEHGEKEDPLSKGGTHTEGEKTDAPAPKVEIKLSREESTYQDSVFTVSNAEKLELKIYCRERCWVKMLLDGEEKYPERNAAPQEEITAGADKDIRIRLGNPGGVKVTLNGIEVREVSEIKGAHNFIFLRN